MSQSVRDEHTSPYAPEAEDTGRVPRLPEPPRFDRPAPVEPAGTDRPAGTDEPAASTEPAGPVEPAREQLISPEHAPPLDEPPAPTVQQLAAAKLAGYGAPAAPTGATAIDAGVTPGGSAAPAGATAVDPELQHLAAAKLAGYGAAERPAADETRVDLEPAPADESIYRPAAAATALTPEQQKLADERAARRRAREEALAAPDVRTLAAAEPVVVTRRSTDRFLGALGLFLLRLVTAAIFAVHGLAVVTNPGPTEATLASTVLPEPRIVALVAGYGALAIAAALVFGLLTRLAGLGIVLIAGGVLTFVLWGNWSPFVPGQAGFLGEFELLLAAVGVLFMCLGAGGFSLDRSFRKSREQDRQVEPAL